MSEKTNIEWATHTFNPWIGCTKVSPGCAHCYAAELDANRFSKTMDGGTKEKPVSHWGKGAPRHRTKGWNVPLRWDSECGVHPGYRARVFPSLCDVFDSEVQVEWKRDYWYLVFQTQNLDWLNLTKRPENAMSDILAVCKYEEDRPVAGIEFHTWLVDWLVGNPPANVWIGVSVEDQERAEERIPLLLQIPATVRFLSVEPLLEKINFDLCACSENISEEEMQGMVVLPNCLEKLDWVIVGGESGSARRDCGVAAICDVARQCQSAGVPCFVKQDSAFKPGLQGRIPPDVWAMKEFPEIF